MEFIDAPFAAAYTLTEQQIAEVGGSAAGRSWFQWVSHDGPTNRPSKAVQYVNWERSLAYLCEALVEHRPDGLLGFSQGAAAAALLLAELQAAQREGRLLDVPAPRFAVLCAGFLPRDPSKAELMRQAAPDIPTLVVAGTADTLVPMDRAVELADVFAPGAAQLYEHPGAHMVPTCSGAFKGCLVEFLDRFRDPDLGSVKASASVGSGLGEQEAVVD